MPVKIKKLKRIDGDIFNAPEEVKVVTINCVGAMGKGVAESAKAMYPDLYQRYRALCKNKAQHLNHVWDWTAPNGKTLIMFPTKDHFKNPSIVSVILDNIHIAKRIILEKGYKSVAFPGLGMGNGWLKAPERFQVFEAFINAFRDVEADVVMYVDEWHLIQYKKDLGYI